MLRTRATIGFAVASLAIFAASAMAPAPASADDARLTVAPAVYQTDDSGSAPFAIELVRHGGYYGGGWGWGGGYRGYGWGGPWGGVYRPYYRPRFYGAYGGFGYPAYGYGYGYPAYGYPAYGYGYPAYGYGPGIGFGVW
jgi:hypothetical protein